MIVRIQNRRGLASEWVTANPTLSSGEFGYETDTGLLKIGNSVDAWNDRDYLQTSGSNGQDGEDGDSAYEIAVANGFVGTEEEWLDSLSPLKYVDGAIFSGTGETVEDPLTISDGAIKEVKLSGEVITKLNTGILVTERESNTVLFDQDYVIGNADARTGDVLFDFTGAKLFAFTRMRHEDANPFTLPGNVIGGTISDTVPNFIYFLITDITLGSENVDVTISQTII